MLRLLLITLAVLTATSCSDGLNAHLEMAGTSSLKHLGLAVQSGHDSLQLSPGGNAGEQGADAAAPQPTTDVPPTADRHILYRASINLQVKSFADTESEITALVKAASGFVSQFSEDRSSGAQRGGRWTVRLPVASFSSFLDSVAQLGVADRREVQSQDVTEEYVDLEARLKNKQALESRLLDLVANRSDHIKDVIALETELGRVREEIERLQGRLRYLKDRVSLTTIEITAYERLDYQPPEATFSARIVSTFGKSLDILRQAAESIALALIAFLPWAMVLATILLPALYAIRRCFFARQLSSSATA
jgi:hypothetical protein